MPRILHNTIVRHITAKGAMKLTFKFEDSLLWTFPKKILSGLFLVFEGKPGFMS